MRAAGLLLLILGVVGCSTSSAPRQRTRIISPSQHPFAQNGTDPRGLAFVQLAESMQGRMGHLPGGCATLVHERVCLPRVTVDGQRLPDLAVLAGVVGVAANAFGPRLPLGSLRAMQDGIALAIFQRLLRLESRRDGIRVTTVQARALAKREMTLYEEARHQGVRSQGASIPPGLTVQHYFLSPRAVEFYRRGMVVGRERQRILQRYRSMPLSAAFHLWFRSRLAHHVITINGSPPAFSLPNAFPANP